MTSGISNFVQGKAMYAIVAAGGLLVSWLAGSQPIQSHRVIPGQELVNSASGTDSRPQKDDIINQLPFTPVVQASDIAVNAITLPVPAALKIAAAHPEKLRDRIPTPMNRPKPPTGFESCLPGCETRDRLVTAASRDIVPPPPLDLTPVDAAPVPPESKMELVVDDGRTVFHGAIHATLAAFSVGKTTAMRIVGARE
ncbi:hypothetical protein A6U87_16390 [Rhizobium sp. AC44/96]|uniref:hypothetical protein n=1 Tax=Rhizobium sp. AC44/96 TaxID=1841654 RepID=UPI00080FA342|nr:hypothetical protein [Rhizobium sp. AC44/96]OCJ04412.1 hypothetical protein A6U87_16390 [Rhizobium sp. AC44/96]